MTTSFLWAAPDSLEDEDAYIRGYIEAILQRKLAWNSDAYQLEISSGIAHITLLEAEPQRRIQALDALQQIKGLRDLTVSIYTSTATVPNISPPPPPSPYRFLSYFPVGDVFQPLLADPKQQQFFMSFLDYHAPEVGHFTAWSVGFGETFGILRWPASANARHVWQLSLLAGIFSQFDWSSDSKDLINADYTFGTSLSYRHKLLSSRLRLFHQSSHLGDEFLLNNPTVPRVNLSYEAVDWLGSIDWEAVRFYGGGGFLLTRDPEDLKRASFQTGLEYEGRFRVWGFARPVAGVDVKWTERQEYHRDLSVKAGVEIGKPGPGGRQVRLLGEFYNGYSPFGQFFNSRLHYYGLGLYHGL